MGERPGCWRTRKITGPWPSETKGARYASRKKTGSIARAPPSPPGVASAFFAHVAFAHLLELACGGARIAVFLCINSPSRPECTEFTKKMTPIATPLQGGRPERPDLLFLKLLYKNTETRARATSPSPCLLPRPPEWCGGDWLCPHRARRLNPGVYLAYTTPPANKDQGF